MKNREKSGSEWNFTTSCSSHTLREEERGQCYSTTAESTILILRSTGIELRFQLKALNHEVYQVIPTGKKKSGSEWDKYS